MVKKTKAYQYANNVLSGKTVAGQFIIKACQRFMDDIQRDDIYLDIEDVERVTSFFEDYLCVPELKKSFPLQLPHAFWIQQLFGWKYTDTGLRRFDFAYLQFARKSFKTYYAAGYSIVEMLLSNDTTPMIMQGANTRDQAMICTAMTGKIIKASPSLHEMVDFKKGNASDETKPISLFAYKKQVNKITYEDENRSCVIEAMPKDPGDGGNPSVGIVDEFHESKDSDLLETIQSGQGQRLEPLTMVITSPGHNKTAPCYANLRKKSVDILNEIIEDDSHLAIIYELDSEDEWNEIAEDSKTGWKKGLDKLLEKSNPMIPYSPTLLPYLKKRVKKANDEGGEVAANIKIKNGGIWVDAASVWIPSATIKKNNYQITDEDLKGKECYCGLDLSGGTDLNAFVAIFPNVAEREVVLDKMTEDGDRYEEKKIMPIHAVKSLFWIPTKKLYNRTDGVDYLKFVENGEMSVFDGDSVNPDEMGADIIKLLTSVDARVIGADPALLRTSVAVFLGYGGYLDPNGLYKGLISIPQTLGVLSPATDEVEMIAYGHQFDFMNSKVMEMCFSNTTLHHKEMINPEGGIVGHRMPSKGKSNGRIDGVAALVTGVAAWQEVRSEPDSAPVLVDLWN